MNNADAASTRQLEELYGISPAGISLGLDRIRLACVKLGHPEQHLPVVQVAGTNGKGSVSTMLAAAFRQAGLRTGLFTSPHIHRFTERIRIQSEEIPLDELSPYLAQVLALTRGEDAIALTFFEAATLAALLVFQAYKVDVAVLEVGLGGRLDATTIATPAVGVITSIGLDHTNLLGHRIEEIAAEKAGIVKPGMTLCCGAVSDTAISVIQSVATAAGARLVSVTSPQPELTRELSQNTFFGQPHQLLNASLAHEAFLRFMMLNHPPHSTTHLTSIFVTALLSFGMPCRFERIVCEQGEILLDGAHNMEAMSALIKAIDAAQIKVSRIVFGALKGKPADEMLVALKSACDNIIIVQAPIARSMDADAFAAKWRLPKSTITEVLSMPLTKGVTLITGSFFIAAEARRILLQIPADPQVGL